MNEMRAAALAIFQEGEAIYGRKLTLDEMEDSLFAYTNWSAETITNVIMDLDY